jgi:hypothetical protein
MGRCVFGLVTLAVLAAVGWAAAFWHRRRAIRYRAAFDRAFAVARRVYDFTDDEKDELSRIIGEPIEHGPSGTER